MLEAARVSAATLPVIDISGLSSDRVADRNAVGANLRAACLDKGFFYISNHGVPEDLVQDVFAESAAFFALPAAQKAEVDKSKSKANRGYEPLQGQTLEPGAPPDLKEGYYVGPEHTAHDPRVVAGMFNHGPNQWPAQRPRFRPEWPEGHGIEIVKLRRGRTGKSRGDDGLMRTGWTGIGRTRYWVKRS
jgi:isopenicillin N synthase-like dioxygenase